MNCHLLAQRIAELQPELAPSDVARLCLLIFSQCEDPDSLSNDDVLRKAWRNASFRLEAATDQHSAVSADLENMCSDGPVEFTPDQLWILLRAVKVQSQILELYTDDVALVK